MEEPVNWKKVARGPLDLPLTVIACVLLIPVAYLTAATLVTAIHTHGLFDGWQAFAEWMSPYNGAHFFITMIMAVPSAIVITIREILRKRRENAFLEERARMPRLTRS
jgi:hypothetical protein